MKKYKVLTSAVLAASMIAASIPVSLAQGTSTWAVENHIRKNIKPAFQVGYSGEAETFTLNSIVAPDGTLTLTEGTDFDVAYKDNAGGNDLTNVGQKVADITFKGNYTGTRSVNYNVVPYVMSGTIGADVTDAEATNGTTTIGSIEADNLVYAADLESRLNGAPADGTGVAGFTPSIKSNLAGTSVLGAGTAASSDGVANQFAYSYSIGKEGNVVKTITVNATFNGTENTVNDNKHNYAGSASRTFNIQSKNAETSSDVTVKFKVGDEEKDTIPAIPYDGQEHKPEIVVKDGDTVLQEGVDYDVKYPGDKDGDTTNATDVGEKEITVEFKGNYDGEKTITYDVVNPTIDQSDPTYATDKEDENDKNTPGITVKDGDKGTVEPQDMMSTSEADRKYVFTGSDITLENLEVTFYPGGGAEPLRLTAGTDYDVVYENNTNAGEATVHINFKGNYGDGSIERKFTIFPKAVGTGSADASDVTEELDQTNAVAQDTWVYTGSEIKPAVNVVDIKRNSDGSKKN